MHEEKFPEVEEGFLAGCSCVNENCIKDRCECLQNFPCQYENGRLSNVQYSQHILPVQECNDNCDCSLECANRVVQHGIKFKLQVFKTDDRGLGVRALENIFRGEFVCEYAGEILKPETAKERFKFQDEHNIENYIHVLKEHLSSGAVISTYIDPRLCGNVGRFINHSCQPNLFMVPVRIEHVVPRLALFALRDIKAGEELCYSYSGDVVDAHQTHAVKRCAGVKRKQCLCKSSNCVGLLPVDQSLIE